MIGTMMRMRERVLFLLSLDPASSTLDFLWAPAARPQTGLQISVHRNLKQS